MGQASFGVRAIVVGVVPSLDALSGFINSLLPSKCEEQESAVAAQEQARQTD